MTTAGRRPKGPFAALDDYDVRHVVTHLMYSGRDGDVHKLLRLEVGEERRNGWFAERERRGDVGGYLDDVTQAWTAASHCVTDAIMNGHPAAALPLELRYALITSSINSLSRNLPPTLLAALVAGGMWSITQALRYAAQQPFAPLRAEAFTLLADQCTPETALDCLRQARSAAREIRHRPDWRVRALGQVAAHAPPDVRRDVVGEALDVLREIGSVEADENVAALMAAVPDDMRDEVEALLAAFPVRAAKPVRPGIDDLGGRPSPWTFGVRRFAELLPGFGEPVRLAIIGAFRNGEEEAVYRGIVIGACAGQDPALAREALDIARSIPEAPLRAEVVAAVSPHLDEAGRARALGELLTEARATDDPGTAAQILTAIVPALPEVDRLAAVDAALSATHTVEDGTLRSYVLRFLTPFVPVERLADVVAEAGRLADHSGDRGRVVAALAPRVAPPLLPDLLHLCQEIADLYWPIDAMTRLAQPAPADARSEVMARALSVVAEAPRPDRLDRLEQLIPYLDTGQFRLASSIVDADEGDERHEARVALARHATDDVRVELVERAGDPVAVAQALLTRSQTAASQQRAGLLEAAWRAAAGVDDLAERLRVSVELLEAGECGDAAGRARKLLAAVTESNWSVTAQASAIASLVPFLPDAERPDVVDDVLARIRQELDEVGPWLDQAAANLRPMQYLPYESGLSMALTGLYPHLTAMQDAMMLGIIRDIRQEAVRSLALTGFAEHAPGAVTVPGPYFDVASTFTRLRWWASAHCAALRRLPDGQQRQALIDFLLTQLRQLTGADTTLDDGDLWNGLIPYLGGADLRSALDIAATVQDTATRDYLMRGLATRLDETEAIEVVSAIQTPRSKVQALIALAERGDSMRDRPEFLAMVGALGADTELLPIVTLLPDEQRLAVLEAAALQMMGELNSGSPPADYLVNASPAQLGSFWQEAAPTLAGQRRDTVFKRIADLDLFLRRAAGDRVAVDIATVIADVVRWWP
jgi:hypothetical protein